MGVRITTSMLYRTTLGDVSAARARLAVTQEQASSNLRVNRPSDDPVAAHAAMLLRDAIAATEQYDRNAGQAQARIRATEDALADTGEVLSRARELAVAGASDSLDAASRRSLASEVEGLFRRLTSSANASFEGAHLFAGYEADQPPFTLSGPFVSGAPAPTAAFAGDPSEVQVEVGDGVRLPVTLDGRRVFLGDSTGGGSPDPDRENLFAVLGSLRDALQANDRAATAATLDRFDRGLTQVGVERARLGSTDAQLEAQRSTLAVRLDRLKARLSDTQDADVVEVYSTLARQEAALEASLQSASRLLSPTLLQYLS